MTETRDQNAVKKGLVVSQEAPRQPPEARKSKEMDSSLGPTERTSPANTWTLAQGNLFWTSELQNYKRINFCCINPSSLW